MKSATWIIVFCALLSAHLVAGQEQRDAVAADELAIKAVIQSAYLEGIHINRDIDAVRAGFHPDFIMHVLSDGQLIQAPLEAWLERLKLDGKKTTSEVMAETKLISIAGNTATVRMEVYKNGEHVYSDFFGLYRFADGWKIVNKIFQGH